MSEPQKIENFLKLINESKGIIIKISRIYFLQMEDREDFIQDTVISAWRAYPNFREQAKFSTWLYRIALNNALMQLRSKKRELTKISFTEVNENEIENNNNKMVEDVYHAAKFLNDAEKALLSMYLEELSYDEIANILGISNTSVGVKIHRLKTKLKKLIKKYD